MVPVRLLVSRAALSHTGVASVMMDHTQDPRTRADRLLSFHVRSHGHHGVRSRDIPLASQRHPQPR